MRLIAMALIMKKFAIDKILDKLYDVVPYEL